jgi:cell wall-active antibiotic response 4TMS protein YvqF
MQTFQYNRACGCIRCRARGIMGPALMITVGVLALLDTLDVPRFDWDHTWPLMLIVIGLVLVFQRNASTDGHVQYLPSSNVPPVQSQPPSGEVRNV